jgi:hypothetical protein
LKHQTAKTADSLLKKWIAKISNAVAQQVVQYSKNASGI